MEDLNFTTPSENPENNQNNSQPNPSNGFSIAALVCGILGIIGGFIPVVQYFTTILSILAIIFGVQGKKKSTSHGLATAGFVLGIVSLSISVIGIVCIVAFAGALAAGGFAGL
ncbi:MAG: hypothetical protein RR327_07085, partial [Clostridia bacterium]